MRRIPALILSLLSLIVMTQVVIAEADLSNMKRPEGLILNTDESTLEKRLHLRGYKALRMIKNGKIGAATEDGFSNLKQEKIDRSHLRAMSEKKIKEGQAILEEVAQDLSTLYASATARNQMLDETRQDGRMRMWTNQNDQSVEAAYISLVDNQLTIQTPDGNEFQVPLDQLIEEDQKIAQLFKQGLTLSNESFLKAVRSASSIQVSHLIEHGFTPSDVTYGDALSIAVRNAEEDSLLQQLIALELNIDAYNSEGLSALSVAAIEDSELAAKHLMDAGASPTLSDQTTEALNPLLWALHKGHAKMAVLLANQSEGLSVGIEKVLTIARTTGELEPLSLEELTTLRANQTPEPEAEESDLPSGPVTSD